MSEFNRSNFKQGDRTDKDNYRLITILPTVSKVIERPMHSQLYDYLALNNVSLINLVLAVGDLPVWL